MLGLALIAGVSFADDIKPQSRLVRLGVQVAAMLLVFYELNLLEEPWYFTLVALVFFVGVINAYNFMDGINGITGGYSLVVVGSLWFINAFQVNFVDERLLYVLLLAILVFNWFNFRTKARCFAGDVGAVSMAFILVFLLGLLILKTNNLSYMALYGVDTILTIIHRLILKENIFLPHRKHLFQLMANELKIPHVVVSLVYMVLQALVSMGLIMTSYKYEFAATMVVLFVGVYVLFMRKYYKLHKS
jgi:UDP-N-acetylmuramyl pentapeptide phosphotransferase/UDP-N-acetylglucosamine-1-phosphate transferase